MRGRGVRGAEADDRTALAHPADVVRVHDDVDEHARVRIRFIDRHGIGSVAGVLLVVRIRVAILHQEIVQREVELIFPDVISERIQYLAALLIPDVRLALNQRERRFVPRLTRATAQVCVQFMLQIAMHEIASVLMRHNLQRRIFGQALGHHV